MIFIIFRDFSRFFLILFSIKNVFKMFKKIKKITKSVYISRGATWMRRGTQGHVAAPRGPTRRLRGIYIYIVYLYIIYNRGFQLSVDRKGIQAS